MTSKNMIYLGENGYLKYGIRCDTTKELSATNLYVNYRRLEKDTRPTAVIVSDANIITMVAWVKAIKETDKLFKNGAMEVTIYFDTVCDHKIPQLPFVSKK